MKSIELSLFGNLDNPFLAGQVGINVEGFFDDLKRGVELGPSATWHNAGTGKRVGCYRFLVFSLPMHNRSRGTSQPFIF